MRLTNEWERVTNHYDGIPEKGDESGDLGWADWKGWDWKDYYGLLYITRRQNVTVGLVSMQKVNGLNIQLNTIID